MLISLGNWNLKGHVSSLVRGRVSVWFCRSFYSSSSVSLFSLEHVRLLEACPKLKLLLFEGLHILQQEPTLGTGKTKPSGQHFPHFRVILVQESCKGEVTPFGGQP
jgi:hypothetical protein